MIGYKQGQVTHEYLLEGSRDRRKTVDKFFRIYIDSLCRFFSKLTQDFLPRKQFVFAGFLSLSKQK